jgi:hypothetical protein
VRNSSEVKWIEAAARFTEADHVFEHVFRT